MSDAIRFLNDLRSRKVGLAGNPREWSIDRLVEYAGEKGYRFSRAELRLAYGHLWQVEAVAIQQWGKPTGRKSDQEG